MAKNDLPRNVALIVGNTHSISEIFCCLISATMVFSDDIGFSLNGYLFHGGHHKFAAYAFTGGRPA